MLCKTYKLYLRLIQCLSKHVQDLVEVYVLIVQ